MEIYAEVLNRVTTFFTHPVHIASLKTNLALNGRKSNNGIHEMPVLQPAVVARSSYGSICITLLLLQRLVGSRFVFRWHNTTSARRLLKFNCPQLNVSRLYSKQQSHIQSNTAPTLSTFKNRLKTSFVFAIVLCSLTVINLNSSSVCFTAPL